MTVSKQLRRVVSGRPVVLDERRVSVLFYGGGGGGGEFWSCARRARGRVSREGNPATSSERKATLEQRLR